MIRQHPMAAGFVFGVLTYWAFQHFTGVATSGKGAQASPGAGKPPAGA